MRGARGGNMGSGRLTDRAGRVLRVGRIRRRGLGQYDLVNPSAATTLEGRVAEGKTDVEL